MKKLILIPFLLSAIYSFSQTVVGFYSNGEIGKKVVLHGLNTSSTYLLIPNDSTLVFDSSKVVNDVILNASSDSIYIYKGGAKIRAIKVGGTSGGGGTAAGSTNQIQYNSAGAFGASSLFTYNPSATASGGVARNLYMGTGTLTMSANNDTLVGADFYPPGVVPTVGGTTYLNPKVYAMRSSGVVNFSGTFTPSSIINNTTQTGFYLNRNLSGADLQGSSFMDQLTATANNATLTGVRITPSFNANGFSNVTNNALLVSGGNTSLQAMTATTGNYTGMIQMGASYPSILGFQFGSPAFVYNSATGTTVQGQAASADDGITGTILNDFYTALKFSGSTYYIGTGSARRFGFSSGGGMKWFTAASEPATPSAGSVVEWFDGTNKKWKKSDGSTGIIY